jgi:fibronectin-binding autotransporter adhesin
MNRFRNAVRSVLCVAMSVAVGLAAVHPLMATTWKLATGGDWGNANNWNGVPAPPDNGATVVFPDGLSANAAIGINKQFTVNSLELTNTAAQFAYTLQSSAQAGVLKFVGNAPAVTVDADSTAQHTISVPLVIDTNAGLTFTNNSMVPLTVSAPISGNNVGRVVFASSMGPIRLSGTSSYVGTNDIRSAQVSITKNAALGDNTSPVEIAFGGSLQGIGGATLSVNRIVKLQHIAGNDFDATFSGDDVNVNNIFQIDSKVTNLNNLNATKPNLVILNGVRLTNAANDFVARDFIYLGGSQVNGRLYLSNDGALGNAANKIYFQSGLITAEDTFTSAREIDLANEGVFSVNANKTFTLNGNVIGGQRLTKQGPGTLELGGTNTYTLSTRIEAGTLAFSSDANLGAANKPVVLLDGATLRATAAVTTPRSISLGPTGSTLEAATTDKTFRVDGTVGGGELLKIGPANLYLTNANNSFGSSRVTNGGLVVGQDAALGAIGGSVSMGGAGFLFANDTFTSNRAIKLLAGSTTAGIAVSDGKTLTLNSGINGPNNFYKYNPGKLVLPNGSTSSIGLKAVIQGGTLDISGSFETAQGLYNSKGTLLEGKGAIKGLFDNQGKVKPGKSPGTLTVDGPVVFEPTSEIQVDMNAASGVTGGDLGWGLLDTTGLFQTSGPVTVDLDSLLPSDDPGLLPDFDPNQTYHWEFVRSATGISGFQPGEWTVDASQFLNSTRPGYGFSVEQVGSSLYIDYGPVSVPEPAALTLAALAAAMTVMARSGHRRRIH